MQGDMRLVDPVMLAAMTAGGANKQRAIKALYFTGSQNVNDAWRWLKAHKRDADIDEDTLLPDVVLYDEANAPKEAEREQDKVLAQVLNSKAERLVDLLLREDFTQAFDEGLILPTDKYAVDPVYSFCCPILAKDHNLKAQWQRMMNKVYNNQQSFPALTGWGENTCVFHPGGSTTKAMTATADEERNEGEGNKADDAERPSIVDVTDCIFVHRLADFARLGNASYTYPPSRPRVNLEFVWVYRDGDYRLASLRTRDIYLVPLEANQLVLYRSPPVSMQCLLQYKMQQREDIVFYFTQPPEAAQQNSFQIKAFTLTSKRAREEEKHGQAFLKLHPPEERVSVEGYERSEEGLQFVDCTAEAMLEGKDKENVHPDIRMYKCRVTCPSDVDHTLFCIQYNWYYSMRFLGVPEDAKGYELQATRDPSNVTNLSPVVELSAEERQRFLRSDDMKYNFKDARFQDWIQRNNLAFDPSSETDVDYAHRILRHIVATVKYTDELEKQGCGMGGVAAGVVDLNTDCGGYSLMFTSTMRYNGIPARLLQGQHANPEIFGLLGALNGGGYVRQKVQESFHCMAEFYSDRLKQWIPVECTNGSERMFGRDRSKPFFTKHYDYIYHLQCESNPPVTSNEKTSEPTQKLYHPYFFGSLFPVQAQFQVSPFRLMPNRQLWDVAYHY